MAYFKLPHYITFVKNYPLTITGKVQKYKMRKEALRLYNLEHLEQWSNRIDRIMLLHNICLTFA